MKTSMKIFTILFIILLFFTNIISLATDINMNLQTTSSNNEFLNDSVNSNEYDDETSNMNTTITTPSTTITTVSNSEEPLSLANILNILLIVVGVVLILLGIAILIRIHS